MLCGACHPRRSRNSAPPSSSRTCTGNLIGLNCEHIANWCAAGGYCESHQTRNGFALKAYFSFFFLLHLSGNIGCVVLEGTARCDIRNRDWSPPPRPAKCPPVVNFGQGLAVSGSGPGGFVCAGDTALNPSDRKLAYGTDSDVGGFSCESATTGMTCTSLATKHGFFISIGSYKTF
jgi:hypothetical protein